MSTANSGAVQAPASMDPGEPDRSGWDEARLRLDGAARRIVDIVVALALLVFLSPLFLVIGLLVKLGDRGPVFHSSTRMGRHGRPFQLYCFRTMVNWADRLGPGVVVRADRRVTPTGRWLRASRLDKLPTLLNVLRGQMSLVGPHAEDPYYVAHYTRADSPVLQVRPGLTGPGALASWHQAQWLAGPDAEEIYLQTIIPARLQIDQAYLWRRSLWTDLGILARTVAALLGLPVLPDQIEPGGTVRPVPHAPPHGRAYDHLPGRRLLMRASNLVPKLRNRHFLAIDVLVFLLTPAVALTLRLDARVDLGRYGGSLLVVTLVFLVTKLILLYKAGLYSRYWRLAGIDELAHIMGAGLLVLVLQTVIFLWILEPARWVAPFFPQSIPLLDGVLALLAVGGVRYSVPLEARFRHRGSYQPQHERVLVVGAGSAGVMIVQEMQQNPHLGMWPIGFVDDAAEKQGMRIRGMRVLGPTADIARVARDTGARQAIIAIPTAPGKTIRRIVEICEEAGVRPRTIPGMYSLLNGTVSIKQVRDVQIEDLLRRDPVVINTGAVAELIRGKRVLITGGGGSIGSELCRQVLRFGPQSIVILGHGENSVFEIHNELLRQQESERFSGGASGDVDERATTITPVIGDIRLAGRLRAVFAEHRPEIVFHSAAHKHVPLMELNPSEAITNNVLGTRNVLQAARAMGVEHFVMISTDKAVNPTSVMGASKRAAELLVYQAAQQSGKRYVAVRFGNVLGSRGSVVLTFQRQIAAGGPVTITHPEMVRFFMTIPEAVQLVLQAAALARGGETFMLDMGDPVRIRDMAEDLIKLSGLQVNRDIDIIATGIRPGEKLFEELFIHGEEYASTRHEKIFIVSNARSFVPHGLDQTIENLARAAQENDNAAIVAQLRVLVPEFHPTNPAVASVAPMLPAPTTGHNEAGPGPRPADAHTERAPTPLGVAGAPRPSA